MSLTRFLFRTICFLVLNLFARDVSSAQVARVLHHDLQVGLHFEKHSLRGTDNLRVQLRGASEVLLELNPQAQIDSVMLAQKKAAHTFKNGVLRVEAPADLIEDEVRLQVSYAMIFNDPVPQNPVNAEDPSYGVSATIFPDFAFLLPEAGWYPTSLDDRPSIRLRVEAPAGVVAISSGRLVERATQADRSVTVWEIDYPTTGISLSAGRYLLREKDADGISVYACFFSESESLAETYLNAAADYLKLYEQLLGPYPFSKFAVVENFFPTGYGFPSYTLLGSSVIRLPFIVTTSLGHEVAHSWWGNSVFVDYSHGNWSEGLTTYLADHLYKERTSPDEGRAYRMQMLRNYATLVVPDRDFALADFGARYSPASRAIGYGKGAMVFHMARRLAGDAAFWKGLREVYRIKRFQTADWDDFAQAFGASAGIDFTNFFDQWVNRVGAPNFILESVQTQKTGNEWRVSGVLVQQKPYYELHVPVRLTTAAGEVTIPVHLRQGSQEFEIRAESPPRRLIADPDVDLFRRLHPDEISPDVNAVRGSTSLVAVVAHDFPAQVRKASLQLLAALGRQDVPVFREEDVELSRLRGHDVLYFGVPQKSGFLPVLPEGLSLSVNRFEMDGTTYNDRDDALFAVLRQPSGDHRIAAIFLPLSGDAATVAARKIPHYGNYGILTFRRGSNRVKKIFPVRSSPLIHVFPLQEKAS